MRALILGAALLALSSASNATIPHKKAPAGPTIVTVAAPHKSVPDMSAMFAIFDKIFPPQPDPDPVRLAQARTAAAAMWPQGAYANAMTGLMGTMYDRVMQLKPSDFTALGGNSKGAAAPASTSEASLHAAALAKDPYFDQRSAAVRQVMNDEAGQISAILDPRIREGLARSMARRFDQQQLADINAFFATPSGHALAAQYMQLWVDPDMMRSMFAAMPEMMKVMPDLMQKAKAASEKFPSPPKPAAATTKH